MPLNSEQQEAVDYFGGPLLVLAGPGTGKTQLLSAKVAKILTATDANPDEILCITFTDAGAENMRERLLSVVGPTANKVNIYTYHAFGIYILGQYQNYEPIQERLFENTIDEVKQHKVLTQIIQELDPFSPLRNAKIGDVINTLSAVKSARLTADTLKEIYSQNEFLGTAIADEINSLLQKIIPRMQFEKAYPIYEEILERLIKKSEVESKIMGMPNLAQAIAEKLSLSFQQIDPSKPSIKKLTDWKRRFFVLDEQGNYRVNQKVAQRRLKDLVEVVEKYQNYLVENKLFDYADMVEAAIEKLKTNEGFRQTLSERFQYILLDEFQDTNPAQFELIKLITDYEQPQIMAVGDDDQAIYEFQGASASNLLIFREHYDAKVITLKKNYRSGEEILSLSKNIAEQLNERFSKTHNINKILSSFQTETLGQHATIERHEFIASDAENYWVVEKIHSLIEEGVAPEKIAVIAPKHKYLNPLLACFTRYPKIPLSYDRRDNLFLDERIEQILKLSELVLAIAEEKTPSTPILEIMGWDFWQLESQEIIETFSQKSQRDDVLTILKKTKSERMQAVGKFLANLALKTATLPVERTLNYLCGIETLENFNSGLFDYWTEKGQNTKKVFEFYENLLVLVEKAKNYYNAENISLKELVEFAQDMQAAEIALANTSPYRNAEQAVSLMSAHKSKGLEFEYVFLIAVDNLAWGVGKGNNDLLALPINLETVRHTGKTEDETLRLFFVAITRAKKYLFMTNAQKDFNAKNPARLSYLAETINTETDTVNSPFLPTTKVIQHSELSAPEQNTDLAKYWGKNYLRPETDARNLLKEKMKNYRLSASDLTSFINIIYNGPKSFYEEKILPNLSSPATESQIYGTAIHHALEKMTNQKIGLDEAKTIYGEEIEQSLLDEKNKPILKSKGEQSLTALWQQQTKLFEAENSLAEVDLRNEHIVWEKVPIVGVIDYLRVDEKNKTVEIFDFKTGKYYDGGWGSHPSLYMYALQLTFYKILLENSQRFRGFKAEKGHIIFATPDLDNQTYDKIYDFDLDLENEVKKLIPIIYNFATNINFVEDEKIFITANKNNTIKDIKNFQKLLVDNYS